VRWYLRYPLSYEHVAEIVGERGIEVDASCIWRWVQALARIIIPATQAFTSPMGASSARLRASSNSSFSTRNHSRRRCASWNVALGGGSYWSDSSGPGSPPGSATSKWLPGLPPWLPLLTFV
jgi:hypothetical protein